MDSTLVAATTTTIGGCPQSAGTSPQGGCGFPADDPRGGSQFVVIGSQAILGTSADPPESMLRSPEADLYPLRSPELADAIDCALGDGSQFQRTYGYYAHGVGPQTAKAPRGWEQHLVPVAIPLRRASDRAPVAWCLEAHDLILSKCVAGRDRDWEFAAQALNAGLVQPDVLLARVADLPVDDEVRQHVDGMLRAAMARQ